MGIGLDAIQIKGHHCKRFFLTLFFLPESGNGLVIACICSQVKSAQSFDRDNIALFQQVCGFINGIPGAYFPAVTVIQGHMGATCRTGIGLGMKPAVAGVFILGPAFFTHLKMLHGGAGSVIGDIVDDGVARTAVGAVDKRIAIAAVVRVKQFGKAVVADGDIRGNQGIAQRRAVALSDGKIRKTGGTDRFGRNMDNMGKGRFLSDQITGKQVKGKFCPLYVNGYARGGIGNRAVDTAARGQLKYKGPETNPLYNPFDR